MKITVLCKDSLRYFVGIAVFIFLIIIALLGLLKQLNISAPEPRQPCEFPDSIKLKLGKTQVSLPTETDLLIIEGEGEPKFSRRRAHAKSLLIQACYDNKPFHIASSLQKTIIFPSNAKLSDNKIEKQWPSYIYVSLSRYKPRFMADGIYATKQVKLKSDGPYRRDVTEKTGYKSDASSCYFLERTGLERCSVYRYLEDLDLTISMYLNTSDVNSYGRSVYKERQPKRKYWPELMDKEEKYWRAFIIKNEDSTPPN